MSYLLDTCIMIDAMRLSPTAERFLNGLDSIPHLSVTTISELRAGQRGDRERGRIDTAIAAAIVHDVTKPIAEEAGAILHRFGRSHGVELADALIAATAIHHKL
jgi:predicted nucleic acid-binding protein